MLSVVIPALDAADRLGATLAALAPAAAAGLALEVVVADGGSSDRTADVARAAGARVVSPGRGRGLQLSAGAEAARGRHLLFLHADTRLSPGWAAAVARFVARDPDLAGTFRFRLDDPAPAARRLERVVDWRVRRLGLPWGDQGLVLPRRLYDAVGGFRPLPLMEDVDMVRRLGRRRIVVLDADAVTSADRYRREGYLARPARNLLLLSLYFAGVPPARLARLYGPPPRQRR